MIHCWRNEWAGPLSHSTSVIVSLSHELGTTKIPLGKESPWGIAYIGVGLWACLCVIVLVMLIDVVATNPIPGITSPRQEVPDMYKSEKMELSTSKQVSMDGCINFCLCSWLQMWCDHLDTYIHTNVLEKIKMNCGFYMLLVRRQNGSTALENNLELPPKSLLFSTHGVSYSVLATYPRDSPAFLKARRQGVAKFPLC